MPTIKVCNLHKSFRTKHKAAGRQGSWPVALAGGVNWSARLLLSTEYATADD